MCASLLLTGCGFNMQTLQQYTPAHGVNVDLQAGEANRQLKVRNLLVVADESGKGVLSASIVSPVAAPHGFVCFTIAAAGAACSSLAVSSAASPST